MFKGSPIMHGVTDCTAMHLFMNTNCSCNISMLPARGIARHMIQPYASQTNVFFFVRCSLVDVSAGGGLGGEMVGGSGADGAAVGRGPAACGDDAIGSSPNLVRISAHAAESDDVMLLHHLGSDHSDSEASLSSSMASCRLNPQSCQKLGSAGSRGRGWSTLCQWPARLEA